MSDQAEYSSHPSLEVSPVITPPKTEAFWDTLMKKILQSHPDMNPELTQEILLKTEKTNTLTIEQQQHLDTILTTLLQHPNSYNILSLPSYIKTITKDIKNNSIQWDTNLYINNLIGGQKTVDEITKTQEEQIINQKEQNINQNNQEKTKILKAIADHINSVNLNDTRIAYTYNDLANNPSTLKALNLFAEALWYKQNLISSNPIDHAINQVQLARAIAYINYNI